MSKQSIITSFSVRYSRSMDAFGAARASRRAGYGRLGADGGAYEPAASVPLLLRVPRKLRILRLGRRKSGAGAGGKLRVGASAKAEEEPSRTFLGRVRLAYERVMLRAAAKSGEISVVPVAKASRAPSALSSVVSTYPVWAAFGSRTGAKISDLDPGFKMTSAEKKYLEHLKRTAASGRF